MSADTASSTLLDVAFRAADAAREATLLHWRRDGLSADNKDAGGGYDPVTAADRAAEAAVRAVLADLRPADGILGEEEAPRAGESGLTWVIDPIDGTRAFLIGAPTWGVLIALNDGARPTLGVLDHPAMEERLWGDASGAWLVRGAGAPRRLSTRKRVTLAEARLCSTYPEVGTPEERMAFERVRDRARLARYGMDCMAYGLLALGGVDLVVEAGLQPYDIQALIPIVEGAGGVVTGWDGGDAQQGGRVVASASPALHAEALALLAD